MLLVERAPKNNNFYLFFITAVVSWCLLTCMDLRYLPDSFIIIYNLSYYTTHNIVPNRGTIAKC